MAKEALIFLVDDDELYLLRLRDHLKEKLYFKSNIYTFTSGEDCLQNLSLNPSIIVLDYYFIPSSMAPSQTNQSMNGLELIRRLRELRPDIYLIMLSCETDAEVANKAISEGAADYIIKYEYAPVQLQYLINNLVLNRIFTKKVNYLKWAAMVGGGLILLVLLYMFVTLGK